MALKGYLAKVKVISSGVAMTDEATSTSDDTNYQITNATKRILDLNTAIIVEDDGTVTTESYDIDYINGIIGFETIDATRVITVTGAYVTPVEAATAKSFSFTGSADALETTAFQNTSKTYQPGLITATAELGRFHVSDDIFIDALLAGELTLIEYYVNDTDKISFYGVMTNDSISSEVAGLIEETISYQVTTQIGV